MEINNIKPILESMPVQQSSEKAMEMPKVEGIGAPEAKNSEKAQETKETKEKSDKDIREAVDKLNKTAMIFDRSLRFQVHEKTHRTMVSVVDLNTDKVIRQIPNEEVLDLVAKMDDYLGLIFDKKA